MSQTHRSILVALLLTPAVGLAAGGTRYDVLERCQQVMVKVYGTGGVAGLEGYQSGVFLAGEPARVLTVDSAVLEEGSVSLVDAVGDRCEGQLVGRDAVAGLALIECPETYLPPASIDLTQTIEPAPGQRVWVFSNAFGIATGDEAVSVQHGRVATIAPMPTSGSNAGAGYRPPIGAPTTGTPVLLLDAVTSNPGTGGGVVFSQRGEVLGIVGAECRSPNTGAWINYALPADAAAEAVERTLDRSSSNRDDLGLLSGQRLRLGMKSLGIRLIPSVTRRTPAYVEYVTEGSQAELAGCLPDDLIVAVSGATVGTVEAAERALTSEWERAGRVDLTVLRANRLLSLSIAGDAP